MSSRIDESEQLVTGASAFGLTLDTAAVESLLRYLDRIYAWNSSAALTSIPREEAVRLHLLDSLSVVPSVPAETSIADLGTGAGLPGIPIAIALPNTQVTLLESRRRKCSFLEEAVRDLRLRNCLVIHRDARALARGSRRFDAVVARAFLSPREFVAIAAELLVTGGRVLVMGARRDEELAALGGPTLMRIEDRRITLPSGTEQRRIVVLQKN